MNKGRRAAVLAALFLLVSVFPVVPSATAQTKSESVPEHVPGQALIGAKANGKSQARQAIENNGGRVVEYNSDGNFFVVKTPSAAPEWVAKMEKNRSLRYAELDYILHADTHGDDGSPRDDYWNELYGIQKIGSEIAWDSTTGSSSTVVGVIDTGIDYTHPDLAGNMWTNSNGHYGRDCRNDDNDPFDDHGHGTHVAGTIGAVENDGPGVVGVNWTVKLMALKFLSSSGSGSTSDAVECLYYAIDNGANLTSNSWGGGGFSQALFDAIKAARTDNQLFVAAAGNDGYNNDDRRPSYPAGYELDNVISVAATDSKDALASWSNYGEITVDVAAPGVSILSTVPGGGWKKYSGTSMATPHVAGAAALLLAQYPSATYKQLLDRIYGSVDRIAGLDGKVATGGRLNVARAIEGDTTAPAAATLTVDSTTPGSVSLSWLAPAEDGVAGGAVSSYELRYRLSGTTSWSLVPTGFPKSPGGSEAATIGGLRPGKDYDFQLAGKDNVGLTTESVIASASTAAGSEAFFDAMDPAGSEWQPDSTWAVASEYAHTSAQAWSDSTGVSLQDPGDPHANRADYSLVSPSIDLSNETNPVLTLWQRYQLERNYDYGYIYCNKNNGSWTELAKLNGMRDFHAFEVPLTACEGSTDVKLRFRMKTDMSVVFDGWYIDNVIVRADSNAVAVSDVGAAPSPFSPNGDTNKDTTTISFDVNKAADWTVAINSATDCSGSDLQTFSGSTSGGTVSFTWDGADGSASTVPDGAYGVCVSVAAGSESDSASSSVTVDTTAPAITGGPSDSNVTSSSADISWTTGEASDSTVYYSTTSGSGYTSVTNSTTTTTHSVSLTGLSADTTYYYYVTSTDAAGNTVTSAETSFSTAAGGSSLSVSVVEGKEAKRGPWFKQDLDVTVTDGTTAVGSANVSLEVRSGDCTAPGAVVATGSGTTDANGKITFEFKSREAATYCALVTASASGYDNGQGQLTFTTGDATGSGKGN